MRPPPVSHFIVYFTLSSKIKAKLMLRYKTDWDPAGNVQFQIKDNLHCGDEHSQLAENKIYTLYSSTLTALMSVARSLTSSPNLYSVPPSALLCLVYLQYAVRWSALQHVSFYSKQEKDVLGAHCKAEILPYVFIFHISYFTYFVLCQKNLLKSHLEDSVERSCAVQSQSFLVICID